MADQIIEGTWEDILRTQNLHGRRVRVIVMDNVEIAPAPDDDWIARLREWSAGHPPVGHFVDDSRESIYDGN